MTDEKQGRYSLKTQLWLPQSPEKVFPFFADANNLEQITPPWLHFKVLTPSPIDMKVGALIDYKLRLRCVPIRWRTEITAWEPPFRFVDRQLKGPYRTWIHEHRFEAHEGGTMCYDNVSYEAPGGRLIGGLITKLLVRRDIERIFAYRQETMRRLFTGDAQAANNCP